VQVWRRVVGAAATTTSFQYWLEYQVLSKNNATMPTTKGGDEKITLIMSLNREKSSKSSIQNIFRNLS
jgi:hypothetical protein